MSSDAYLSLSKGVDSDSIRFISVLPQLTEPFFRPDASRERATGGVGLGLHLCKLVAQAHGGRMVLRNAHPGLAADVFLPA